MPSALDFYRQQSPFTDPGPHASLLNDLPRDPARIAEVVQGLVYHYRADEALFGWSIPPERLPEIDTRYASRMLARLIEMDDRPLRATRPPDKRIIGCCRDFTLLFCTIARHKGIPARARYGFATYFSPGYYIDHVVAEYWNDERWVMTDAELSPAHIEAYDIAFDVGDVTAEHFLVGGRAWQLCRAGEADPDHFCVWPDAAFPRGLGYVAHHVLQDVAALNRVETLCWDTWVDMLTDDPLEHAALFDEVAATSQLGNAGLDRVIALYTDPRIRPPAAVNCWSPAANPDDLPLRIVLAPEGAATRRPQPQR